MTLSAPQRRMLAELRHYPSRYPVNVSVLRALIRRGLVVGPYPFLLTDAGRAALAANPPPPPAASE